MVVGSWLPGVKRADIFDSGWGNTPLDRTGMQFGGRPIFETPVGRAGGNHSLGGLCWCAIPGLGGLAHSHALITS